MFEQALARIRRDMELDEKEHQARLTNARKREEELRRAAGARVVKRQVRKAVCQVLLLELVDLDAPENGGQGSLSSRTRYR